jgi:hypothetical protein
MQVKNEIVTLSIREHVSYGIVYQDVNNEDPFFAVKEHELYNLFEFIHSTSWRFKEGVLYITWVVSGSKINIQEIPLEEKDVVLVRGTSSIDPRPIDLSIKNVVSHGIRHLALLLKTDPHFKESISLMPELKSYLSKIKIGVAGELH